MIWAALQNTLWIPGIRMPCTPGSILDSLFGGRRKACGSRSGGGGSGRRDSLIPTCTISINSWYL